MSNQYNGLLVSQMSEPLDVEKNAELYLRVAAGDSAAREEMIAGNMPLAIRNSERFIRLFPQVAHLRDDLTSAAFLGLVKAVNGMAQGCEIKDVRKWDAACYMGTWINRELGRLVEDENPIRVPHTSKDRANAQGQELPLPSVQYDIPERFEIPSYEKELAMRDLIESCCTCEEQRTFVAMREAGHTLVEIAAAIGKSVMFTQRMGKQLGAGVMRKLEALRDE